VPSEHVFRRDVGCVLKDGNMRALSGALFGALAVASTVGCFSLVDVDHFHTASSSASSGQTSDSGPGSDSGRASDSSSQMGEPAQYLNFKFTLVGMTPHITQLFEYRIIDANNFVQSRGVVNPLGSPNVVIDDPRSIPKVNGPFHLDFYADVDFSGNYDGIGSVVSQDHAWRIDPLVDYPPGTVTPVDGLVQVTFTHNTSFTDIDTYPSGTRNPSKDTGLGATIHIINAQGLQGDLMQARVVDTGANRTVALDRMPKMVQPTFDLKVPGVVEEGVIYNVLVYVDANGNGNYDNPATGGGDLGWSVTGTADTTGLNVTLDAAQVGIAKVDVGAP
jgi:hypothetical protein